VEINLLKEQNLITSIMLSHWARENTAAVEKENTQARCVLNIAQ
jgi:hypothetical protein